MKLPTPQITPIVLHLPKGGEIEAEFELIE
jgi:hypothetical protein